MSYKNRSTRKMIFKRDGWRCYICSRRLWNAPTSFNHKKYGQKHLRELQRFNNIYATLDHYMPYHTTKNQRVENLFTCCDYCNHHKGEQVPCCTYPAASVISLWQGQPKDLGNFLQVPPLSIIGGSIHVVGAGEETSWPKNTTDLTNSDYF